MAAEAKAAAEVEDRAKVDKLAAEAAIELAEIEARLAADARKRHDAIVQAKISITSRIENEQRMTELASKIAQARIVAAVKTEEKLKATEIAASTTFARVQAETSALNAIQARIESDALAIEQAIAREAVEAMAKEAADARTKADQRAIAQASQQIQQDLAETEIIRNNQSAEETTEEQATFSQEDYVGSPLIEQYEEEESSELSDENEYDEEFRADIQDLADSPIEDSTELVEYVEINEIDFGWQTELDSESTTNDNDSSASDEELEEDNRGKIFS